MLPLLRLRADVDQPDAERFLEDEKLPDARSRLQSATGGFHNFSAQAVVLRGMVGAARSSHTGAAAAARRRAASGGREADLPERAAESWAGRGRGRRGRGNWFSSEDYSSHAASRALSIASRSAKRS